MSFSIVVYWLAAIVLAVLLLEPVFRFHFMGRHELDKQTSEFKHRSNKLLVRIANYDFYQGESEHHITNLLIDLKQLLTDFDHKNADPYRNRNEKITKIERFDRKLSEIKITFDDLMEKKKNVHEKINELELKALKGLTAEENDHLIFMKENIESDFLKAYRSYLSLNEKKDKAFSAFFEETT